MSNDNVKLDPSLRDSPCIASNPRRSNIVSPKPGNDQSNIKQKPQMAEPVLPMIGKSGPRCQIGG